MFNTPVLFLIFNRPDLTSLVFEEIKKLRPKFLFISADGPRKEILSDSDKCKSTREIVMNGIDWECNIKTLFRDKNAGCKKAVSEGIIWFFENVEQGIILEDDCLPNTSFFEYCEELLEKFKDDENIISISGSNFGYQLSNGTSYGFSRFMNMWGWATWKRSVALIDYEMTKWKRLPSKDMFLYSKLRGNGSLDTRWISYWKNLFNITASGKLDTWDYQWVFAQLRFGKLSIFPAKNLVENIGFSENATHTKEENAEIEGIKRQHLSIPLVHPEKRVIDDYYEEIYIKKIWANHVNKSLFEIFKTRLLYIPMVHKLNKYLKGPA